MTVAAEIPLAIYDGDGVTTAFPAPWRYLDTAHLLVELVSAEGEASPRVAGVHYSATAGTTDAGGTVTMLIPPATGQSLRVRRVTPLSQPTLYPTSGAFPAKSHELALDRLTLGIQEQAREQARALQVPVGETGVELPGAADRADKALFFDADGNAAPRSIDDFSEVAGTAAAQAEMLLAAMIALAAGLAFDTAAEGVDPDGGAAVGSYFVSWEDNRIRLYLNSAGVAVFKAEFATLALLAALAPGVSYPELYGAVGDGVTDDSAAVLAALESGKVIDGRGKTYALGSPVVPASFKGLRNANFVWANPTAMALQAFQIAILNQSRIFVEGCTFDLGTVENCGSADDSSRGGLKISTTNENVTFNDYVRVQDCRAFGKGNGTAFYLRSNRFSIFSGLVVHDRVVAATPDPGNDCQNGIDVGKCRSIVLANCVSRDQTTRLAGVVQKRFSRGFVFTELWDSSVIGCDAVDTDQGFDWSGAITATLTQGNRGNTMTGCTASGNHTYGFKFANCTRDMTVSGCVAREFGFCGFVFSGPNSAPLDATKNTQRITLVGCHAADPTGTFAGTNCYGFRMMENPTYSAGYPRGIKMIGCTVSDATGGGKLVRGFQNDVTYDNSGHTNELIGCSSIGHVDAASVGFTYIVAQLPASAPLGTRMTVTDSNSTTFNATVAGGGANVVNVWFNGTNWKIG